jgi:hypothetical protein
MNKHEFRGLFLRALDEAAENAELVLGRKVPRSFLVELHAPDSPDESLTIDGAVDRMYLGEDRFYRITDVAIRRVCLGKSVAFVRVSGHAPGPFSETWDPTGLGPFKQLIPETIEQSESIAE